MQNGRAPAWLAVLSAFCILNSAFLTGCDGESGSSEQALQKERQLIPAPTTAPVYTFAPGLLEQNREIAAFVRQFLEVCMAGDYSGYRQLVSRTREPESRERFQAIYYSIRNVRVEAIDEVTIPLLDPPVYRVVAAVDLDPNARVSLRGSKRSIALLVFREDGEWKLLPAPASLQPVEEEAEPESQPAPGPEYPWDQEGDG